MWYSLLICLCHIRLFHCVNFSLYNFHWQNIEWCILVNVNIPLLQLLEILEKQRRCRWQSQSPLEYCETASQDKLSQHLYMHAWQHWDVAKDICVCIYVCIGVYILARTTLELQSSLNIYTKHKLYAFILFFFAFLFFSFFTDSG